MYEGVTVSPESFGEFVKTTPTHFFKVSRHSTVNRAGWHAAHILDAKDGDVAWRSWTRSDAKRRFVRNVHPLNVFYVPKAADWHRVGGDPALIGYVASVYARRWPTMWNEFTAIAGTPELRPDAGDRILRIGPGEPPPEGDGPAGGAPAPAQGSGPDGTPWDFVLARKRKPKALAEIVGRHPDPRDASAQARRQAHGGAVRRPGERAVQLHAAERSGETCARRHGAAGRDRHRHRSRSDGSGSVCSLDRQAAGPCFLLGRHHGAASPGGGRRGRRGLSTGSGGPRHGGSAGRGWSVPMQAMTGWGRGRARLCPPARRDNMTVRAMTGCGTANSVGRSGESTIDHAGQPSTSV